MMRRKFSDKLKSKVTIVGAVAFMAVAAAVVGVNILSSNTTKDNNKSNLVDLNELPDNVVQTQEESKVNTSAADNIQADNYSSKYFGMDNVMDATNEVKEEQETHQTDQAATNDAATQEKAEETNDDEVAQTTTKSTSTKALNFQAESKMSWPLAGNVLINYSMDSTVYFATLNQYKYNSALIIQGEVNSKVASAADGIVEEIFTDEETGISMKVDLGNGYKAIYGQLKEITVKQGDTVSKGSIIGYVSEPSKYYSIEGSNLYFKVTKDDSPVNPLNFLE
ncbi:M23 family metallopeptidase [Candidatus Galacturonibacter soehngenii]|uniref:M23 family metallopeptidase n=1 Tax=Candidatus Galacturonatibacter soehngenii TaxID=2307010 RepID=A0A7V7QHA6_9FIRM|nr:M23 family metallopeptidase [Candidatus Galacturonibacter soehngenii]KAB1434296.1 M23 family metallopeptidase [Candidatus Galacturonibacter soehngenii]MBA4687902.1 M23 family metallopeptidase [Candidatus Galacturonibacter soehngenii]